MKTTTISPDESRARFPGKRCIITRKSDHTLFVLQPDGLYVMWDPDPKFREPLCVQHRYEESVFSPDYFT